ncbi:hypothetical protein L1S35_11780 [Flavobacterium sp. AS60]|uniref:hypothetical protein n=1 Tax=Flavobacterium anseongense TaxID=2910677 RepID=UPI001F478E1D|nr:hypothetical protein [Flavobacterium sp. AS60]MCF6130355.1 hypothetical protein [Flavobacterium sp. AS60]
MKRLVLLFILISSYAFSQSVNDYQYVIVPVKFDFFKKDDQYGLNTLTKLLLQKYGFKAYLSNEEIPQNVERCNFLYANVLEKNGVFITKVKIVLKDCQEKVIFETQFGESREKEFAVAYNLALRDTGKSFDKLDYKYNGVNRNVTQATTVINQIETEPIVNSGSTATSNETFYFAQPIANGYQVVDSEPKVIMKLINTSQKYIFLAEKGDKKGVVLPKGDKWVFEYYENGKTFSEPLNLKF